MKRIPYHGEIDGPQTEKLLAGKKVGTYLLRYSKEKNFFSLAFVSEEKIVHYGYLYLLKDGKIHVIANKQGINIYAKIEDLLAYLEKCGHIKKDAPLFPSKKNTYNPFKLLSQSLGALLTTSQNTTIQAPNNNYFTKVL